MNQMRNYFGGRNGQNSNGQFNNPFAVFQKFQQFMQNPMSVFMGSGLDIPQNCQNNPEAITNYLRSSGKMTDDQFNQASQMAQWAQNIFGMFMGKK